MSTTIVMLNKLRKYIEGRKAGESETTSLPQTPPPLSAPNGVKSRPSAYSIVDALRDNDIVTARRQLREQRITLRRERLPGGDCWVLGEWYVSSDFKSSLASTLEQSAANNLIPRIVVGRSAFWKLAAAELLAAGQMDELRRRVTGVLTIYNPHVYLAWARLMVLEENELEAGKYFLFSGLYEPEESRFVERFKHTLARAHENEIVGRMPGPCTWRQARRNFPQKVYEDLATIPCPQWLRRRPAW